MTDDNATEPGRNSKLVGYLVSAGAAVAPAGADASTLYLNPDPDLTAIDADLLAAGGIGQVTVSFSWNEVEVPGDKKAPPDLRPENFSVLATADPTTSAAGVRQVAFRTDDFAGARVAGSVAEFGSDVRIALRQSLAAPPTPPNDAGGEPAETMTFAPGDLVDADESWGGSKADLTLTPTDGIAQYLGFRLSTGTTFVEQEPTPKDPFPSGLEEVDIYNYGWLRYTLHDTQVTLHELALETTPGVGIQVGVIPVPSSLPLLASGAAGLAAFRARRQSTCRQPG